MNILEAVHHLRSEALAACPLKEPRFTSAVPMGIYK